MINSIQNMSAMPPQFQQGQNQIFQTLHSQVVEKLVEKTGIDSETLEAAFKDGSIKEMLDSAGITREDMDILRTEALEELVAAGEISESQAERLSERPSGPPPRPPEGMENDMALSMTQVLEQMASELGLESTDELLEMLPEGTSLWSFAKENGISLFSSDSFFNLQA